MSQRTWRYKPIKRKPKLSYWSRPTEDKALNRIATEAQVLPPSEFERLLDELIEMQPYTHNGDYSRQIAHVNRRISEFRDRDRGSLV